MGKIADTLKASSGVKDFAAVRLALGFCTEADAQAKALDAIARIELACRTMASLLFSKE